MKINSSISVLLNELGHWENIWIHEWNSTTMSKQQNILFNNSLDFKAAGGGIIEHDTKILTLYFHDICKSNSIQLIGEHMEWIPWIWMQLEQEKLKKLNQINIVCLRGDLTQFFHCCQQKFINVEINYYQCNLHLQIEFIQESLIHKKLLLPAQGERKNNIYSSTGSMRLNRYILIKEGRNKGYDFYYPAVSFNLSKSFEHQISRCIGTTIQPPIEFEEHRIFKNTMTQSEFNRKQVQILSDSYINFVTTMPSTDWLKDSEDEKYFDTILCKTVPFMLCEKNSNSTGLELLGFLPYVGFNLESDSIDNPVLRWKSLLEDNEHIFKDEERVKELYDKNQHVIDHNYNRLVNTDWEAEKAAQLDRLPMFIKEYLGMLKYTTPN